MNVFVVGATGVLGRQVIGRLLERGHAVTAVARQAAQVEKLQRVGITAAIGDILDAESLVAPAMGCDVALHLATAIPKPGQPRDFTRTNRIRTEGAANLIAAAKRGGVRRYIQQSVVFVYGDHGGELVDETTPIQPDARPVVTEMERLVRESGLKWCILRGGLFYGPLSGQDAGWRIDAAAGSLQLPGDGTAHLSLVHEADMANAVVLATENAASWTTYNIVDDQPVTYQDLFGHIAAREGAAPPIPGGATTLPDLACSNTLAKAELRWKPGYPTYRSGIV